MLAVYQKYGVFRNMYICGTSAYMLQLQVIMVLSY